MDDHQFQVLIERLDALADIGESAITAMATLTEVMKHQDDSEPWPEDPQLEKQEPTVTIPSWATLPDLDKPTVHYDLVVGPIGGLGLGVGEILVWFEHGAPQELKEFLQRELLERHIREKIDPQRIQIIRCDLDAALMDFSQYGITLRIPPFEERYWEFHVEEAEEWMKQKTWGEHNLILGVPPIPPPGRGTGE